MANIVTKQGTIFLSDNCSVELIDSAIRALTKPAKFDFKTMVKCDQYDDEVWHDCRLALDGELIANPEELVIAQEILDKHLSCEEAQALLQ